MCSFLILLNNVYFADGEKDICILFSLSVCKDVFSKWNLG
jgi:hypothetical protein